MNLQSEHICCRFTEPRCDTMLPSISSLEFSPEAKKVRHSLDNKSRKTRPWIPVRGENQQKTTLATSCQFRDPVFFSSCFSQRYKHSCFSVFPLDRQEILDGKNERHRERISCFCWIDFRFVSEEEIQNLQFLSPRHFVHEKIASKVKFGQQVLFS